MSIGGVGLYYDIGCTLPVPEVGSKFVLSSQDIYDFGKVLQFWIKNMNVDRTLKNMYVFITHDSSLTNFGVRFASLARLDGITDKTQSKLFLLNQNIAISGVEGFSIRWDVPYGITNLSGQLISLVISNNQINVPVFV